MLSKLVATGSSRIAPTMSFKGHLLKLMFRDDYWRAVSIRCFALAAADYILNPPKRMRPISANRRSSGAANLPGPIRTHFLTHNSGSVRAHLWLLGLGWAQKNVATSALALYLRSRGMRRAALPLPMDFNSTADRPASSKSLN